MTGKPCNYLGFLSVLCPVLVIIWTCYLRKSKRDEFKKLCLQEGLDGSCSSSYIHNPRLLITNYGVWKTVLKRGTGLVIHGSDATLSYSVPLCLVYCCRRSIGFTITDKVEEVEEALSTRRRP